MQGFIKKGLTASLLAVAVVASTGAPAAATTREPGEDPGDGPIERPTPPRPTPPPRQIESFSVSTDSVVATATLHYNGDPSAATVLWGDGTSTSRCPAGQEGPMHSGCMPNPFDTGDPAGTLVLKHRYAAPANGAPFTVAITAKLGAESQTVRIGVTPRYKVTVSDIEFSPLSHCDTAVEEETEWAVGRTVYDKNEPSCRIGNGTSTTLSPTPGSSSATGICPSLRCCPAVASESNSRRPITWNRPITWTLGSTQPNLILLLMTTWLLNLKTSASTRSTARALST